jgi:hypothetical protein
VIVNYATGATTGDAAATAGEDYSHVARNVTYAAGTAVQTILVRILDDATTEEAERFTVTLSNPAAAYLAMATATGRIPNDDALQLEALQVIGAGTMYPAFDPAIHHYALTCADATAVRVTGSAAGTATSLCSGRGRARRGSRAP